MFRYQQHQQQPIMRNFLGLGTFASDDQVSDREPYLANVRNGGNPGFHGTQPTDFTGANHLIFPSDLNLTLGKSDKEKILKESEAETHGLTFTQQQWQVPLAGPLGGPQTRELASNICPKTGRGQLTIFYGGNVNVFDNIPVDQAQAIMHMAASDNSLPSNVLTTPLGASRVLRAPQGLAGGAENLYFNAQIGQTYFVPDQVSQNCPSANVQFDCPTPSTPSSASDPQPMVPKALPLARKASLARFLEKRKERMQRMAPYMKQQLAHAQLLSPSGTFVGFNHTATICKFYEEHLKKRMPLLYDIQEPIDVHNAMSPWGVPVVE